MTEEEFGSLFQECGAGARGTFARMAEARGVTPGRISQLARQFGYGRNMHRFTPDEHDAIATMRKTMSVAEVTSTVGCSHDTVRRASAQRGVRFGLVPMSVATADIGHAALRLYVMLACHADRTRRQTWVSVERLAELMGVSERQIFRLMSELEGARLIDRNGDITTLRAG